MHVCLMHKYVMHNDNIYECNAYVLKEVFSNAYVFIMILYNAYISNAYKFDIGCLIAFALS